MSHTFSKRYNKQLKKREPKKINMIEDMNPQERKTILNKALLAGLIPPGGGKKVNPLTNQVLEMQAASEFFTVAVKAGLDEALSNLAAYIDDSGEVDEDAAQQLGYNLYLIIWNIAVGVTAAKEEVEGTVVKMIKEDNKTKTPEETKKT